MGNQTTWTVASDAELVRRGRLLTVIGLLILCLGSVVMVLLMSMSGPETAVNNGGPTRIPIPTLSSQNRSSGRAPVSGGVPQVSLETVDKGKRPHPLGLPSLGDKSAETPGSFQPLESGPYEL